MDIKINSIRISPKGRGPLKAIEVINLATRDLSTGHLKKNILDLLKFDIINGISKDYWRIESYLELALDHFPIIIIVNSKVITKDKFYTLHNAKTNWPYFQELLVITLNNPIPLETYDDIVFVV